MCSPSSSSSRVDGADRQSPTGSNRTFVFADGDESLSVEIEEVYSTDFGFYVWPSAPVLAQFIWHRRDQFKNKSVLELGAGTSLPGIVATKIGARVTLTDAHRFTECRRLALANCRLNRLTDQVRVESLTWGRFDKSLMEAPAFDYVIAADCFYDPNDFEDVLMTVSFLLDKNPEAVFYTTYQARCADWSVACLLASLGLQARQIDLSEFGADRPDVAGSNLPGRHTIQLLVIGKKKVIDNTCK